MSASVVASPDMRFMSAPPRIYNLLPGHNVKGDLIQGMSGVNGRTLTVLYDSGATHSLISHNCVTTL